MRVLELSSEEAGAAFAGKLFARWGSEVIKVEAPDRPRPIASEDWYLNGGKRRVFADYRTIEGRRDVDRLAATCDVMITDVAVPDIKEFDLLALGGPEAPSVRTAITPFGLTGPYAAYPATDATLLALGGYTTLMGDPDRAPLTLRGHYANYQAGTYGYLASLAAVLRARKEAHLQPQTIEVSALECLLGLGNIEDTLWLDHQRLSKRSRNRSQMSAGTMLPCRDGWFGFTLIQEVWMPFALMLGRPDLIEGHVFSENAGRHEYREEFEALVSETLSPRLKHEIFTEGQERWRVPIGYTATLADCLDDRHLESREFWRPFKGAGTELRTAGSPFRFMGEPVPAEYPPTEPGSDTDRVSREPAAPAESASSPAPGAVRRATRPLEGVRILDLGRVWAGPLAARILGDLGADVIGIESATGRGPAMVPPGRMTYTNGGDIPDPWDRQPLFNKRHRNRRGVCLDLKHPKGREIFLRLVAESDVVLENFSARAMGRLDLGYARLREVNERIIYIAMPAFGSSGPYQDYIGYGAAVEPMTGIAAITGYGPSEPRISGQALTDPIAGVAAAAAILTALERRTRTGTGVHIDLSQHEAGIALFGEHFIERQSVGMEPERLANADPRFEVHGVYRCAGEDDWIAIAARTEREWEALCTVAGQGWERDARFVTTAGRVEHRVELDVEIEAWTTQAEKMPLMLDLLEAGVPAGAVLDTSEYMTNPHLRARSYFADLHHPSTGTQRYDGSPLTFNGERGYEAWLPAPKLGEHNYDVLHEVLGMTSATVAALTREGVLSTCPPA